MNPEEIADLIQHLEETVDFSRHIGLHIDEVTPVRSVFSFDVAEMHIRYHHAPVSALPRARDGWPNLLHGRSRARRRPNRNRSATLHDGAGRVFALATASFRILDVASASGVREPLPPEEA